MSPKASLSRIAAATAAALGTSLPSQAVNLGPNGLGQALIYPYYTVRTAEGGNAFNTYFSVVNTAIQAKAVRVRVREGRVGKPVLDFNLYLGPNDVWTAAMVPTSAGAQLITSDTSCTEPAFVPGSTSASAPLRDVAFIGDGFGDSLDRTREGFVEMIEMATLTGASAAAVSHTSAGVPFNCATVRFPRTPETAAPTGGLSGTLTLINVNSGLDFTLDATALENLTTRAFFHPPGESEPGFASAEIDPVSVVVTSDGVYRSLWARPQDAVSAVMMRASWTAEYVLDIATASLTDVVATLPTRHFYLGASTFEPPFTATGSWGIGCARPAGATGIPGEQLSIIFFNREEQGAIIVGSDFPGLPPTSPPHRLCASAAVGSIRNSAIHLPSDVSRSHVLGSTTMGMGGFITINTGFQNGWIDFRPVPTGAASHSLTSLPGSTRTSIATGAVTTGTHTFQGLPLIGFVARVFRNGTLACSGASSCQGNYGGAFAMKYRRGLVGAP